jgi:hypothetical protein
MSLTSYLTGTWSRLKRKAGLPSNGISPNAPSSYTSTCHYLGWAVMSYPVYRRQTAEETFADLRYGVTTSALPKDGPDNQAIVAQVLNHLHEAERLFKQRVATTGEKSLFKADTDALASEPGLITLRKAAHLYYQFGYIQNLAPPQDTM